MPIMKRACELALLVSVGVCVAAWSGIVWAESEEAGRELQSYFSNANTTGGQANVYISNPIEGVVTCAMIYVFDPHQNMQICCGCPVTADGLLTLTVSGNLAPNPVGSTSILTDGSIRILATYPNASPPLPGFPLFPGENCLPNTTRCCDPTGSASLVSLGIRTELVAWATHVQTSQITESEFLADVPGLLTTTGLPAQEGQDPANLPEACADITQLGSGAGVCTCPSEGPTTGGPTGPT
jgi:hypothetical protein